MPVVQVSNAPSREMYELVVSHLGDLNADRPAGLILHAASETAGGEVQIVDVYESHVQLEAFRDGRLFPAFQAAGVMPMVAGNAPPTPYEPFEYVG